MAGLKNKNLIYFDGIKRKTRYFASSFIQRSRVTKKILQRKDLYLIYILNCLKILSRSSANQKKDFQPNFYLFTIKAKKRDILRKYLKLKGIETGIYYPYILPKQKVYSKIVKFKNKFTQSYKNSRSMISLPFIQI